MANGGGSKNATLTKPGAVYGPTNKQGNDLDSLMAKFNNSLAIQNLMNNHGGSTSSYQGTTSNKSRNTGNVP